MKFLVLFLVVSLLAVNCDLNCIPVVLEGYDVIEYYRMEQDSCNSVLGLSNFTYNLESNDEKGDLRVYQFWFSSQSNLDHFREDPWKYAPKFGGFCSFGVCCETEEDGWPWEDSHLGPPAGPDPKKCGFRVYNHALYFDIDNKHDETFFSDADNNIKLAEERWISWFGSLQAGVFNWSCLSTAGWQFQDCMDYGQDKAPLASLHIVESCGVVPNGP